MEEQSWKKLVQKRIYDVISHRYGILTLLIGAILIVISAFHFGESVMEWSTEKYASVFNSFSDNLAGRSYRERLCLPVPIDVVYTWVNGTDPELISSLKRFKFEMQDELNISRIHFDKNGAAKCVFRNCLLSNTVMLFPALPVNMTLTDLSDLVPEFKTAKKRFPVMSPFDYKNYTAIEFLQEEHGKTAELRGSYMEGSVQDYILAVVNLTLQIEGHNTSIVRCHITPDSTVTNSMKLDNQIVMSGYPHTLTSEELKVKLPEKLQKGIDKIDVHPEKGIAVLHVPLKEDYEKLLAVAVDRCLADLEAYKNGTQLFPTHLEQFEEHVATGSDGRCTFRSTGHVLVRTPTNLTGVKSTFTNAVIANIRSRFPQKDLVDAFFVLGMRGINMGSDEYAKEFGNQEVNLLATHFGEEKVSNFTIDGKQPELNAAHLVWDLRDFSRDEDISASRFEDNEELRYSLRSIERFAPWVRHVYLVTNGQLPYWLNLENTRLTIVTHEEIFKNKSHLPSFGSPAIESNLHNIPGLSDKFIYMNDDVMFGKEVWPDDFFTHSSGQKVYLTWPVPNCNEGCPSSWIRDGYCDKACNVSECEWDAGDCDGKSANQNLGGWAGAGSWQSDVASYCHTGCANNWIADRYCDTSCNVIQCGFDAGDCGTEGFDKLHSFTLLSNQTNYKLPKGDCIGYFNLSTILSEKNATLKDAFYDDNKAIRTIAIAKKFKVLTVILHCNTNKTQINFTIQFDTTSSEKELNFTLEADTTAVKVKSILKGDNGTKSKANLNETKAINASQVERSVQEVEEIVLFEEIPVGLQGPYAVTPLATADPSVKTNVLPANMSNVPLPQHLKEVFTDLQGELKNGEITESGYQLRLKSLWISYQKFLHSNHSYVETGESRQPLDEKVENKIQNNVKPLNLDPNLNRKPKRVSNVGNQHRRRLLNINEGEPLNKDEVALVNIHEMEMDIDEEEKPGKFDSFVQKVDIQPEHGKLLPWEHGAFQEIQQEKEKQDVKKSYDVSVHRGRRTLDTFGDSLRHVNTLYNKAFGYTARKVPGHMPHMIDKHIMMELQARFPEEWDATSSHQVRHSKDMQYAFSYFYYLMGVKQNITAAHVFDEMDTDKSRVLSDREIRTLATRLYELPLDLETLNKLEYTFVNCSKNLTSFQKYQPDAVSEEVYYESEMPQVTRNLFINCPAVQDLVKSNFPPKSKYAHTISDDSEIAFKMIKTNVSSVVGQLDDVRKNPKKFICLNDNIDHTQEQAKTVKAILQDFYESFFPITSQFELPREYRNRFTHIDELREWQRYRYWLKFWTHIALILLVVFTVASYFGDKIEAAQKRFSRRRAVPHQMVEKGHLQTV